MHRPNLNAAIIGIGLSGPIVRRSDQPLGALALRSVRAAAEDAGIELSQIDGLAVYPSPSRLSAGAVDGIDVLGAEYMGRILGLSEVRWAVQVNPGSFVGSIAEAARAVSTGACRYALAWRAMHNPSGQFGRYEATHAEGADQYLAPYGLSNYALQYAMQYSQYLARYGASREHMATYIVGNRQNAAITPEAVFYNKPITRDDYMNARRIADPYTILDCDMPVDGCTAVIITSSEVATDSRDPVYIAGTASLGYRPRPQVIVTLDELQEAAAMAARSLWASSGLSPSDIDMVNSYDGFSGFIYYFLEAYGFCKEGEAFEFIQNGRVSPTGELPMNTNGGSLGMGRIHGGAQVMESVRQIQGRCGNRQVRDVEMVVAGSGNPAHSHGSVVLSKFPVR